MPMLDGHALIQYEHLCNMEASMLANPAVKETEKDIIRKTHTEWVSKNLDTENYKLYRAAMATKLKELSAEAIDRYASEGALEGSLAGMNINA